MLLCFIKLPNLTLRVCCHEDLDVLDSALHSERDILLYVAGLCLLNLSVDFGSLESVLRSIGQTVFPDSF